MACQKSNQSTETPRGDTYKGEAVKNDWAVYWLTANPYGLNPIVGNDGYARDVFSYVFDTLLAFDVETGEAKPRIAESWTVSPDGLVYEFKLRENARFHDGQPVTAEDVKFTYDAIQDPKTDSAALRNYLAGIKRVEVFGPHQVRFIMDRPYFRNLIMLGLLEVLPKHIYGKGAINDNPANRAPVGSGPYIFEKWDTGQSIMLKRNPEWWGLQDARYAQRFNFEKLLFRVITDQNVAGLALKKGDIDALEPTPTMYLKDLAGEAFEESHYRLKYSTDDGNGYRYIAWNLKQPLFQQKEVRQALALLMPRDEINDRMFESLLTSSVGPFPQGSSKNDPSLKPVPYDKAKALELLAGAGWTERDAQGFLTKNGKRFSFQLLFSTGSAEAERIALIYQQALKDAGIDMSIRTLEWTVFLKQRQERKFDALMMSWTSSLDGDPYQVWHSSQAADQGSNAGAYANARVDEILVEARKTLDREQRNKLYHEFSRIIADDQPYLFLFERPHLWVGTKRFAGVLPVGKLGLDSGRWFTPLGAEKYKAAQSEQK
jgi:ABC-type transport system substrate-binding protein